MKRTISLNEEQIQTLILTKSVKFDENSYVELLNDDILINVNGKGYYPHALDIKYDEYFDIREMPIERLQELICEHFNLEPYEVIFSKNCDLEFEFFIRFRENNLREMTVCDCCTAIKNISEFLEKPLKLPKSLKPNIGAYRRLGKSCYYFKWIEDI